MQTREEVKQKVQGIISQQNFQEVLDELGYALVKKEEVKEEEYFVSARHDYIEGNTTQGYRLLELTQVEYDEFRQLSEEEQYEELVYRGRIVIDGYDTYGYGPLKGLSIVTKEGEIV